MKVYEVYHNGHDYRAKIEKLATGWFLTVVWIDTHERENLDICKKYKDERSAKRGLQHHYRGAAWREVNVKEGR